MAKRLLASPAIRSSDINANLQRSLMRNAMLAALSAALVIGTATSAAPADPTALKPTGLSAFGLPVRNLEAERDWYVNKLGMRVVLMQERDAKPYQYSLAFGGQHTSLIIEHDPTLPMDAKPTGRLIMSVTDIKAVTDHLRAQGVETDGDFVKDPEGNLIQFFDPKTVPPHQ